MRYLTFALLTLPALCGDAPAQCRSCGPSCGPMIRPIIQPISAAPATPEWQWVRDDGAKDGKPGWDLMHDGARAGWYDDGRGDYRPQLSPRGLGEPCAPPTDFPGAAGKAKRRCPCGPDCPCFPDCDCGAGRVKNFGVDLDKLKTAEPTYRVGDREVSRSEALDALRRPVMPRAETDSPPAATADDARVNRVVVVLPEAERKPILDALAVMPEAKGFLVQGYEPTHWHVAKVGYQSGVTVVDADGKVLHRQPDGKDLAAALGKLRKPDPNYDPSKDPDVRAPSPLIPTDLPLPPWHVWLAGGVAAAALVRRFAA